MRINPSKPTEEKGKHVFKDMLINFLKSPNSGQMHCSPNKEPAKHPFIIYMSQSVCMWALSSTFLVFMAKKYNLTQS